MRWRLPVAAVALAAALTALSSLTIRLLPLSRTQWDIDMAAPGFAPGPLWAAFCPRQGERDAPVIADPAGVLAALDRIALATPRTRRLGGSPQAGRITWVTRTRVMGFADFTTAQILRDADGSPRLCILGHQAIGSYDWGVNAARIGRWAQALLALPAPPGPRRF